MLYIARNYTQLLPSQSLSSAHQRLVFLPHKALARPGDVHGSAAPRRGYAAVPVSARCLHLSRCLTSRLPRLLHKRPLCPTIQWSGGARKNCWQVYHPPPSLHLSRLPLPLPFSSLMLYITRNTSRYPLQPSFSFTAQNLVFPPHEAYQAIVFLSLPT